MTAPPARAMVEPEVERDVFLDPACAAVPETIELGARALDLVQAICCGPGWCQVGFDARREGLAECHDQIVRPARRDGIFE